MVFSEYHAQGMLARRIHDQARRLEVHYYVGHQPQLFDLSEDPGEFHDLAADSRHAAVRAALHRELLDTVDPEQVSEEALRDQERRLRA